MSKLTEELVKAAGNMFSLYKRTHLHHFNVVGKTFKQDHSFLGELYEQFNDHFDSISELIRIEGQFVPSDFQSKAVLPALSVSYDRDAIFKDVLMSMQIVIASLNSAHKEAIDENSIGTFTTLETIIESMQKSRWMVQSSL
ncbi:MAG TPA: ferritin-like domain-containing protein [Methanosarcina sp.]|nr:ferritin-like domain-containing protein [Methanosarcina sp.]